MKKDSSSITEDFPEQKELREDKSHQSNATTSQGKPRAEVEISADSDRATLLGNIFLWLAAILPGNIFHINVHCVLYQ